jgi:hypothetical protein
MVAVPVRPGSPWLPFAWCAIALIVSVPPVSSQSRDAAALLEQLYAYLDTYEAALGEFVAEEQFRQRLLPLEGVNGASIDGRRAITSRRLLSDVGFLRLPGGLAWLAQRSVRTIDGRPVRSDIARLDDALVTAGTAIFTKARTIAEGNAGFNLGHPRSLNVPTLPLELLSRRHATAFVTSVEGEERIGDRVAARMSFRERPPGAIVAYDATRFVRANVRAWVAVDDGAVLRADIEMDPPGWGGSHAVEVFFEPDPTAGILVPVRLTESFTGRYRGDGAATYSNYRRFRTTGRVLPPP